MRLSERMNKVVLFSSMYADKVAKLEAENAAQAQTKKAAHIRTAEISTRYNDCQRQVEELKLRTGICEWWRDEDNDIWMTSCSNAWVFTNDGPKENDCHYCMYCGGVLEAGGE